MNRSRINIFIVDDDADDRSVLQDGIVEVLTSFEIVTAVNGYDCLQTLKDGYKPDLVFMDLNMPSKNGLECLRDIHNQNLLPNTPVIIYSTSNNRKDIDAASTYGASFYLVKPERYQTLIHLLERALYLLGQSMGERMAKENFVLKQKSKAA